MVVGLLFGPVGVALAILEVLSDVPEGSRILEAGLTGKGEVSITARADPLVSERLAAIGRVHWWGNDQVPVFGPGRLTTTPGPQWAPSFATLPPRHRLTVEPVRRLDDVQRDSTARTAMR